MKSFFKRSAISMAILGMTGSVYANVLIQNQPCWSPQITGAFIGIEGLDLRPMNGDLDYVTLFPAAPGDTFSTKKITNSYDWSWRVYGGINFTENDDISASWTQLHSSDTNSETPTITSASIFGGISLPRWADVEPWENVNGRVTFNYNDAYLVWGHTVNFNNPWSLRFAGGLEYATIKSNLSVIENAPSFAVETVGFESNSHLTSFGPRIEMDATYHLAYGIALFADANAALLIGKRSVSLDPINFNDTDITDDLPIFDYDTHHVVVPKAGARLGASYSYTWGQVGAEGVVCGSTVLTVDLGWQVETYIHAIERPGRVLETETAAALQGSDNNFHSTKTSNFGDSGFFIGIQLGTNWM